MPETTSSDPAPEIPDFVVLAMTFGVPLAAAQALWRRMVATLAAVRAGKITEDQGAARIDRMAGLVFMATKADVQ